MGKLRIILPLVVLLTMFCALPAARAQGPGFDDDTVDEVPVDSGLSLLVITGIGYGIKVLKTVKGKRVKII